MSVFLSKRVHEESVVEPVKRAKVEHVLAPFMEQLNEQGYTVIPNLLSGARCAEMRGGIDRYLLNMGINVHDPKLRHSHYPSIHGIIQHLEIGHAKPIWDVRQEQAVVDVFEAMYGDNDLLVSFDGACVMLPYVREQIGNRWTHVDQSFKRTGLRCVQGYVNLAPSDDERTGSLAVIPGSHKKHAEFARNHPEYSKLNDDWYKFKDHELEEIGGPALTRVHGGEGSLVLWRSDCAHQSLPPPASVEEALTRYVVYVCYQPRTLISDADLRKKQNAFDAYRMTTHWPASRVKLFPLEWRNYGKEGAKKSKDYNIVRDRVETPRMLELAGKTPLTTRARLTTTPLLQFVK